MGVPVQQERGGNAGNGVSPQGLKPRDRGPCSSPTAAYAKKVPNALATVAVRPDTPSGGEVEGA